MRTRFADAAQHADAFFVIRAISTRETIRYFFLLSVNVKTLAYIVPFLSVNPKNVTYYQEPVTGCNACTAVW